MRAHDVRVEAAKLRAMAAELTASIAECEQLFQEIEDLQIRCVGTELDQRVRHPDADDVRSYWTKRLLLAEVRELQGQLEAHAA